MSKSEATLFSYLLPATNAIFLLLHVIKIIFSKSKACAAFCGETRDLLYKHRKKMFPN